LHRDALYPSARFRTDRAPASCNDITGGTDVLADQSAVVHFTGDLDYTRLDEIVAAFAAFDETDIAIIDLSDVAYVDSRFLGEIARLYQRLDERGAPFAVRIVGARPSVRRIFDLTSLDEIVQFFESLQDANVAPL
jgi:anti-sigma B factor antagonist